MSDIEITIEAGTSQRLPVKGKRHERDIVVTAKGGKGTNKIAALANGTLYEITADDLAGATQIADYAFYRNPTINSLELSSGVATIGDYAFEYCSNLSSVNFHMLNSVKKIGAYAFAYCSNLTGIDIPFGVTSIGNSAFRDCSSLTSIDIPDSVTEIGTYTFCNCNLLEDITIPSGVTSIGNSAFSKCSKLTSITFIEDESAEPLELASSCFKDCTSLENVVLPSRIKSLYGQSSVFSGATSLTEVDCYCSNLGSSCFSSTSLNKLILRYDGVVTLTSISALNVAQHMTVYVKEKYADLYENKTNWSSLIAEGKITIETIESLEGTE